MYRLSSIIIAFLMFTSIWGQSPHGEALKINCNQCHNPTGWEMDKQLMGFTHNKTDFKLEGAHTQTDCKACHTSLVFNEAPNQCATCHGEVHSASVGNDCASCHNSQSWLVDNITELHEENGFPLIGAHNNLTCVECHTSETNLRFDRIGNDCINCHREDFMATTRPNHSVGGFSTNCIECHNPLGTDWDSDKIGNHDFFPLTQGHDIADCTQCHKTSNYADADPNCISCHQPDYDSTLNPQHRNVGFSTDCIACHTTNPGWTPANINHDFFPLTLGHNIQDCIQCHKTVNYGDADPNCISCHQADYDATLNPQHRNNGFPTDCTTCHSTNPGWTPANINHDFFPLTLGHNIQDCKQCHKTNNYADADPNCISCHQPDYDGTLNPQHRNVGFSTDCVTCHSTNPGWTPATVNHDFFPLTLGHNIQDCIQCHKTNNYADADPNCVSCHQTDYNNTTNPNHNTNGFPTDCVTCHTTNPGWTPATVNHDFFPLTLGHNIQDCIQCHKTNNYADADPNCVSCHQTDYNNTNNPNHLAAYFPVDCVSCHTTNPGWTPATFDHDGQYFPIYSGKHKDKWNDCIECHTNPNNYSSFTCINCHEHSNKNQVDNDHQGVINYTYSSTSCFDCHPTGRD
jgi:hypothetical protein